MDLRTQLSGTGVAIVTPFSTDQSVDLNGLGRLIAFIINNGVAYIVIIGTTGETPVLSQVEKVHLANCDY